MRASSRAGFPITYLLLVDNSNSMPPFREQLNAFGRGLAENSGENTRFILATFGDEFQVISDSVPAEELEAQLAAIPLDEPVTRLHTSMNSALDYLEAMPRQGTELARRRARLRVQGRIRTRAQPRVQGGIRRKPHRSPPPKLRTDLPLKPLLDSHRRRHRSLGSQRTDLNPPRGTARSSSEAGSPRRRSSPL